MYEQNKFNSPWVTLKNLSPLVWGFILLIIAGLLAMLPGRFFKTLAVLPLVIGALMLYQAIYKNKY